MTRTAVTSNRWALISVSLVLAVFLIVVDMLMIAEERDYLLETAKRHVEDELDLMGELLTEVMIRNDYGSVEQYIPQWSKPRQDVIMVSVVSPNGFEVARFQRDTNSQYPYQLKKTVYYLDKPILDLEIQWDFGAIHSHIQNRIVKLISMSVVAVVLLGLLLWQVLKRTAIFPLQRYIEEREVFEARLEDHARELAMHVDELESYSYSIAHDLRAPVRSVTSFSQVLLLDVENKLAPQEINTLQRIIAAGKYMAQLIDDILALAKITRDHMVVKPLNLTSMAQSSVNQLRELEPHRDCVVIVHPELSASGDPRLIQLLLDNLLGNAWKYTGKIREARIEFGVVANGEGKTFYVKDNVVGFDMQYAGKLFQPFQRLHSREEFEGTGVGLATARRIVNRHGGKIWVESEPDKGTTFYFTLQAD